MSLREKIEKAESKVWQGVYNQSKERTSYDLRKKVKINVWRGTDTSRLWQIRNIVEVCIQKKI